MSWSRGAQHLNIYPMIWYNLNTTIMNKKLRLRVHVNVKQ